MISYDKKSKDRACARGGMLGLWVHFSGFSPLGSPLCIGTDFRVDIR